MISDIESDRQLTQLLVSPTEKIPPVSAAVISAAWAKVGEMAIATIDQANQLVTELETMGTLPAVIWDAVWKAPCWTQTG